MVVTLILLLIKIQNNKTDIEIHNNNIRKLLNKLSNNNFEKINNELICYYNTILTNINIEEINMYAHKHDKYFCEIINFSMMKEVLTKPLDYPAEFLYGSIANKWFFSSFKKITNDQP